MMTDEQPRITDADRATGEQAKELKKTAAQQLKDAIRIRKGAEQVQRVNGIAAALNARWES